MTHTSTHKRHIRTTKGGIGMVVTCGGNGTVNNDTKRGWFMNTTHGSGEEGYKD